MPKKLQYKEFSLSYDILFSLHSHYYEANGQVSRIENGKVTFSKQFRTEVPTHEGAEEAIIKLMQNYIDFEWQQYDLSPEDSIRKLSP